MFTVCLFLLYITSGLHLALDDEGVDPGHPLGTFGHLVLDVLPGRMIANNSIIETTSQMQQSNKYTIIYNDIKMTSQTTYNNA